MDTEDFSLYDSTNTKVVKYFGAVFPGVGVTILSDSLIVKSVDSGNLSGLMVSSEESNVSRIFEFQTEQELESFN